MKIAIKALITTIAVSIFYILIIVFVTWDISMLNLYNWQMAERGGLAMLFITSGIMISMGYGFQNFMK